jgi:hypothetical protein
MLILELNVIILELKPSLGCNWVRYSRIFGFGADRGRACILGHWPEGYESNMITPIFPVRCKKHVLYRKHEIHKKK